MPDPSDLPPPADARAAGGDLEGARGAGAAKVHSMNKRAETTACDKAMARGAKAVAVCVCGVFALAVFEQILGVLAPDDASPNPTPPPDAPTATTTDRAPPPAPPPSPQSGGSGGSDAWIALPILLYGTVPFVVLVTCVYQAFCRQEAVQRRLMRSTARLPIAQIGQSDGLMTRVVGVAKSAGQHMLAPVTNRPCVWYAVAASYRVRRGKRTRTIYIASETAAVDFLIDDGSSMDARVPLGEWFSDKYTADERDAEVLVDSEEGEVCVDTETLTGEHGGGLPDHVVQFLRRGTDCEDDEGGDCAVDIAKTPERNVTYHENVIQPGELVAAAGKFQLGSSGELVLTSPPTLARAPSLTVGGPIQRRRPRGVMFELFRSCGNVTQLVGRLDWARLGTRALVSDVSKAWRAGEGDQEESRAEEARRLEGSAVIAIGV